MVRKDTRWLFGGQALDDLIEEGQLDIKPLEGFVYLITNLSNGRKYVGKKHFWTRRKDRKTGRRKTAESDWRNYYGSSDDLAADITSIGKEHFVREVLYLCYYKTGLTYYEMKEQFTRDVLMSDEYYNTNIGGKFFVSKGNKVYETGTLTSKNDKWREIKSERMTGELNTAKRADVKKKISASKKGDNHHRFGLNNSSEHQSAIKKAVQGSLAYYHGPVSVLVKPEHIELYITKGWNKGQPRTGEPKPSKVYITDGKTDKRVYNYQPLLDIYIEWGWKLGVKSK